MSTLPIVRAPTVSATTTGTGAPATGVAAGISSGISSITSGISSISSGIASGISSGVSRLTSPAPAPNPSPTQSSSTGIFSSTTASGFSRLTSTNNATIGISSGPQGLQSNPRNTIPLVSATGPTVTVGRDLSFNIARPSLAIATPAGIANALGVPTSVGGALSRLGIPTALPPLNEALRTLGVPTSFTAVIKLTGLEFPKIPGFPGLDLIGINLGAGKKWIAEQIAKYKSLIPPFIPGLKINMGVALAAVSVIKALVQVGPAELLKHLLSSIVDDLVDQVKSQVAEQLQEAINNTGINDLQGSLNLTLDGAEKSFVDTHNATNPPQTTTNAEGETVTIPTPAPDVSQFAKVNLEPEKKASPSISFSLTPDTFQSKPPSNLVSFTFPPKG